MPEKEEKITLDQDTVAEMKRAGLEKPDNVVGRNWNELTEVGKPVYHTIAYLACKGLTPKEIGDSVGMSSSYVSQLLKGERMRFEVRALNYKLHGSDIEKRFKDVLPHAIDTAEAVMLDKTTKGAVKLTAAMNFMDRAMGRPAQTVNVEGSLIKLLYDKLNQKAQALTGEVVNSPRPDEEHLPAEVLGDENPNTVFQPEVTELTRDSIDEWASKL